MQSNPLFQDFHPSVNNQVSSTISLSKPDSD